MEKSSPGKNINQLLTLAGRLNTGQWEVDKVLSVRGKGVKKEVRIKWMNGNTLYEQYNEMLQQKDIGQEVSE